jgi:hypothetical protein
MLEDDDAAGFGINIDPTILLTGEEGGGTADDTFSSGRCGCRVVEIELNGVVGHVLCAANIEVCRTIVVGCVGDQFEVWEAASREARLPLKYWPSWY